MSLVTETPGKKTTEPQIPEYRRKLSKVDISQHVAFWRACRFLKPHLLTIIISVICAVLVAASVVGSLSSMLPIIRVLSKGDSVQAWADRQIVERRIGVRLADNPERVQIVSVDSASAAEAAGLESTDFLPLGRENAFGLLEKLSDPAQKEIWVTQATGGNHLVHLSEVPWHLRTFRQITHKLPGPNSGYTRPGMWQMATLAAVFSMLAVVVILGNLVRFFQLIRQE
jgi:hypothetical protein